MKTIAEQIYDAIYNSEAVQNSDECPDMYYCEQMERDCRTAKANLIEVLSKHPNWDEENLRVHFDKDYMRTENKDEAKEYLTLALACIRNYLSNELAKHKTLSDCDWVYHYEEGLDELIKFRAIIRQMLCYVGHFAVQSIEEDVVRLIRDDTLEVMYDDGTHKTFKFDDAHIHTGAKGTKQVMKLLRQYGYEKLPEDIKHAFLQEYSKFADAMNPITITRHTILSVNPVDFLYMSNGNSWTSCHNIFEGGCYCGGCASYAYDQVSMILYTVDASVDRENITTAKKINRQMNFFNGDALLSVRVYPQSCDGDTGIYKECKTIVQEVIATSLGRPNMWKETAWGFRTRGHQYPDYKYFGPYKAYTLSDYTLPERIFANWCTEQSELAHDEDGVITGVDKTMFSIGSDKAICVCCGNYLDEDESPICYDCRDGGETCCECGERIGRGSDDEFWYDGHVYCPNCRDEYFAYCEDCYEWYPVDDCTWIESVDRYVCDNCRIYGYTECECCNEYFRNDDLEDVADYGAVCRHCLTHEGFICCDNCGTWFEDTAVDDDIYYVENEGYICEDCLKHGPYEKVWVRV